MFGSVKNDSSTCPLLTRTAVSACTDNFRPSSTLRARPLLSTRVTAGMIEYRIMSPGFKRFPRNDGTKPPKPAVTLCLHCPTLPDPVRHCPTLPDPVQHCLTLPDPVRHCPTQSDTARQSARPSPTLPTLPDTDPVRHCPTLPDPVRHCPTHSPTLPDPQSDTARPSPTLPDPVRARPSPSP